MPVIETFPVGLNEFILLPEQGTWLPNDHAKDEHLAQLQNLFEPTFLASQNLISKTAAGRGLVYFFSAMSENCVLRHYYRGGLVAKISNDKFIYQALEKTRPYKELNLLTTLYAAGLNVPKPLAARISRKGLGYTADIITGTIERAQELHEYILQHTLEPSVWKKIGASLRQMHNLQACHYDINVKNVLLQRLDTESSPPTDVLVQGSNTHADADLLAMENSMPTQGLTTENHAPKMLVYLLDFDGCKIRKGEHWKSANLARFKRSLEKQKAKYSPYYYDETCWQAIEAGYY